MVKKVYVETSVLSHLAARLSRDLVAVARQRITAEWCERYAGETHSLFEFLRRGEVAEGRSVVVLEPASERRPDGAAAPRQEETSPESWST